MQDRIGLVEFVFLLLVAFRNCVLKLAHQNQNVSKDFYSMPVYLHITFFLDFFNMDLNKALVFKELKNEHEDKFIVA
eukprot:snap_masked-scaffold_23-processed-gene-5.11-mRNA-1 protein AED:1.00 eAED:1.00 QI:0/0/0/0/1/1/2/0/76